MMIWSTNQKCWRKACIPDCFSITDPTQSVLGLSPHPRGRQPESKFNIVLSNHVLSVSEFQFIFWATDHYIRFIFILLHTYHICNVEKPKAILLYLLIYILRMLLFFNFRVPPIVVINTRIRSTRCRYLQFKTRL
jgi:hypothetical protein